MEEMKLNLPKKMHPEAVEFGKNVINELDRQGMIQKLDLNLLNLLCMAYHTYVVARDDILETGPTYKTDGFIKLNPNAMIMKDQMVQIQKIFDQLGMNPRARKQLSQLPEVHGESSSPLDAYLSTNNKVEKR